MAESYTPTREDDAKWAERLGCKVVWFGSEPCCGCPGELGVAGITPTSGFPHRAPDGFSTGYYLRLKPYAITPTWETVMGEIVPMMRENGWELSLGASGFGFYRVGHWYKDTRLQKPTDYSPEAIMQIAAKTLGRE